MLSHHDRLLLLGGSGWFGRSLLAMLPATTRVLSTSSTLTKDFRLWDLQEIRDFAPTVVVNCAFLTRDREAIVGSDRFVATNERLTEQFLRSAELASVERAMTVSSGAAVHMPDEAYGRLKRAEESAALSLASPRKSVVVARVYSVSGSHVRNPRQYAFSSMIVDAARGDVRVRARRPTFRRYSSVEDVMSVGLNLARQGHCGVFESGGTLLEMGALAGAIVEMVNPEASVERDPFESYIPDCYASDGTSWREACSLAGCTPMTLNQQISRVARAWRNHLTTEGSFVEETLLAPCESTRQS